MSDKTVSTVTMIRSLEDSLTHRRTINPCDDSDSSSPGDADEHVAAKPATKKAPAR